MKNLKHREIFIKENITDDDDWTPNVGNWEPLKHEKKISLSEVKEMCRLSFYAGKKGGQDFEYWWINKELNENILPRPYPKTKCLECGEEVCDNIKYKIGHLYNKHNCKPSVDDYKAMEMMGKYFK